MRSFGFVSLFLSLIFAFLSPISAYSLPLNATKTDKMASIGYIEEIEDASGKSACPNPGADGAALICGETGTVLYSNNANSKLPMASTTKIMTAIIICELLPLEKSVVVPEDAVNIEGSSAYLIKGEKIKVETLLYALMLQSANDAAAALAIEAAGSIENFCVLMNKKAEMLGLSNTHFTNPHGLDNDMHYTSALDLARLTAYALKNEVFAKIVSTKVYRAELESGGGTRCFTNHNRLLFTYNGAIGVKTGYTIRTGRCLVSAAERDGTTLICVTLRNSGDWADHKRMLDWGFENFKSVQLLSQNQINLHLPVTGGEIQSVYVINAQGLSLFTNTEGAVTSEICVKRLLFAPVTEGDIIGYAVFRVNGKLLAKIPLVAAQTVNQTKNKNIFTEIKDFFADLLR